MTPKIRQPLLAVGDPLGLAEARYLQYELGKIGLKAKIRKDRSPAPESGERLHVVLVSPEDLREAERTRSELLSDPDGADEKTPGSETRERPSRKSALVLGTLGFVTGLRVGARALGSIGLGIVLAVVLSTAAFCVTRLFFAAPRE